MSEVMTLWAVSHGYVSAEKSADVVVESSEFITDFCLDLVFDVGSVGDLWWLFSVEVVFVCVGVFICESWHVIFFLLKNYFFLFDAEFFEFGEEHIVECLDE